MVGVRYNVAKDKVVRTVTRERSPGPCDNSQCTKTTTFEARVPDFSALGRPVPVLLDPTAMTDCAGAHRGEESRNVAASGFGPFRRNRTAERELLLQVATGLRKVEVENLHENI
jgi:hypothetical protein